MLIFCGVWQGKTRLAPEIVLLIWALNPGISGSHSNTFDRKWYNDIINVEKIALVKFENEEYREQESS